MRTMNKTKAQNLLYNNFPAPHPSLKRLPTMNLHIKKQVLNLNSL